MAERLQALVASRQALVKQLQEQLPSLPSACKLRVQALLVQLQDDFVHLQGLVKAEAAKREQQLKEQREMVVKHALVSVQNAKRKQRIKELEAAVHAAMEKRTAATAAKKKAAAAAPMRGGGGGGAAGPHKVLVDFVVHKLNHTGLSSMT